MTEPRAQASRRARGSVALAALASVAVLWLSHGATSDLLFYSSDTGLRFLQVHSLVEQGWQSLSIDYPARSIDPDLAFVPYYTAYSVRDGDLLLNIGALFPLLVSLFYAALGAAGLCVAPVLCGVATASATAALTRELRIPCAGFAFAGAIGLTPLLFYSLVLWDHGLVAALAVSGVLCVARALRTADADTRWWLAGGALLGLATTQRPEAYLFAASVAIAVFALAPDRWRTAGLLALGGVAGALPLWALQLAWVGDPLGMGTSPHLYGSVDTPPARLQTLQGFLARGYPDTPVATWIGAGAVLGTAALVAALRWRRTIGVTALALAFALCTAAYATAVVAAGSASLSGILLSFALLPLAIASFAFPDDDDAHGPKLDRLLATIALLFTAAVMIVFPWDGGLQWGTRYLLPVYPLLLVLALRGYHAGSVAFTGARRRTWRWGFASLVAVGLLLQAQGARQVFAGHERQRALLSDLSAMSVPLVITDHVHLPSFMTGLSARGVHFVFARNDADLRQLLARLGEQGPRRVGLSPSRRDALHVPKTVGAVRIQATELKPRFVRRIVLELEDPSARQ